MAQKSINPLQVKLESYISRAKFVSQLPPKVQGQVFVLGVEDRPRWNSLVEKFSPSWQQSPLKASPREFLFINGLAGPVWILSRKQNRGPFSHHARLEESDYTWHREQMGMVLSLAKGQNLKSLGIEFFSTEDEQELGALVGLELSAYQYRSVIESKGFDGLPELFISKTSGALSKEILLQARARGAAVNWARHLVNTPPNFLHPKSMSEVAQRILKGKKGLSVQVWNQDRLKKENMGLLLGVGQGAEHPPCLIHIRYRPLKKSKLKPIAFVGKGITFDTGGLDIKPSAGMRLMKKDMGGAAAVFALAVWAELSRHPRPLDFYLAMAENSVGSSSMRPSDVLTARSGMKVEIHNTDAEGRLVLADALDVAATQKGRDEPEMIVDVATLTGACRTALGAEIGGLFSNHDGLAEELNRAGAKAGDLNWRLPLYGRYTSGMNTPFADIVNCTDGFGGAITAALFLEKFVRERPWAHLDVYAWTDKATGSLTFAGGNGQAVQCLIEFLSEKAKEG